MSIYIAGKYTSKERLRTCRDAIRLMGYEVSSSWMDTEYPETSSPEIMCTEAKRDILEVADTDYFILDTLDESITGGREVELGVALTIGASILHVGPKRNVFHYLPMVQHFEDWDAVTAHLWERK